MQKATDQHAHTLRAAGFKATTARLRLVSILKNVKAPRTIDQIVQAFGRKKVDQATVYRALQAFLAKGIVRQVFFNDAQAYYELRPEGEHHHIVCTECGRVEDFLWKECVVLEKGILRRSRQFSTIASHSLEIYGVCKKCGKK